LLQLGLFFQAKDDKSGMFFWWISADVREIQIRGDEDTIFLQTDSDDFRIGRAAEVLLDDCKGITPGLLKDGAELERQVLIDLELHAGAGAAKGMTCSCASAAA
jgi:hypothetical protein